MFEENLCGTCQYCNYLKELKEKLEKVFYSYNNTAGSWEIEFKNGELIATACKD